MELPHPNSFSKPICGEKSYSKSLSRKTPTYFNTNLLTVYKFQFYTKIFFTNLVTCSLLVQGRCCATREMPGHSQLGYHSLSSSSLPSLDSQGFSALRPELPSGLSRLYKETQHSFQVLELLVSVPFEVLYFFKGKLKSVSFMRSELCKPFFLCSLANASQTVEIKINYDWVKE